MDFILLFTGLTVLWLGTDVTMRGATSIARNLKLSEFIVGIGTSQPELSISVGAM